MSAAWDKLQGRITGCRRCRRLREHCRQVARQKRAAYRDWTYWGKPVPNFGEASARLLIVGLAPAAHGANRTGRMFTGDRSGDFLYAALHACGLANQPHSQHSDDGLKLIDIAITAVVHCAPPANKPTRDEQANCLDYLNETMASMRRLGGTVALGRIAFDGCVRLWRQAGWLTDTKPTFAHGALYRFDRGPFLLASYHPSQQNTFTGRLTAAMLKGVFRRAKRELDQASSRKR